MNKIEHKNSGDLAEHLFRVEYGKIVSVITGVLGFDNLKLAEDITQDTFYKAVKHWQHNGIPPNPKAWLYLTAKNTALNALKKQKRDLNYNKKSTYKESSEVLDFEFTEDTISDEQLKMIFVCCNPAISSDSQIALILKILCGFSISEIASSFLTSAETINKRLVRARKKLKEINVSFKLPTKLDRELPVILKAIYLLFNEGYSPSERNITVRTELCYESIRLAEILKNNSNVKNKNNCFALLSLMYLNASRFEARTNCSNEIIEMKDQDRKLWNRSLIDKGLSYMSKTTESGSISIYQILAAISANHCIATEYKTTNWTEILDLYDSLLTIADSPLIRLNRSVALSKVKGNIYAINELLQLGQNSNINKNYLFHSTISEFYNRESDTDNAAKHLQLAITLAKNKRDIEFLEKKLINVVPI